MPPIRERRMGREMPQVRTSMSVTLPKTSNSCAPHAIASVTDDTFNSVLDDLRADQED